jgi:hypothetical protein
MSGLLWYWEESWVDGDGVDRSVIFGAAFLLLHFDSLFEVFMGLCGEEDLFSLLSVGFVVVDLTDGV